MKPGKKKLNRGPYSQVVLEDDLKAIVMQIRSRFADTFSGRFRTIVMRTHNEAVAELEKG